jgi:hypothetical protein
LTNTEVAIDFTSTGDSYQITRAGPNFTVHAKGKFHLTLGVRVFLDQNNSLSRFWALHNSVAIPYFGVSSEPSAAGDAESIISTGYFNANAGDVFTFRGITSLANGATLQVLPAAAPAPAIASAWVDIVGYLQ